MAAHPFDAIVVGARCAGSPTAMLLARRGYRVLLVDRGTFPSDTISTHLIHPPGMAALRRWGLRDSVVATGCPPIDTYAFDFGAFTLTGSPGMDGETAAYAPRRTVLDKLLVDAAAAAGVEVREGFTVDAVLREDGCVTGIRGHAKGKPPVTEHARVVVGADGGNSIVARCVDAPSYREKPRSLAAYYSYWSGLPMEGRNENYILPRRGMAAWPTNDDLTIVIAGWPYAEFEANRTDVEGNYHRVIDMVPAFAERVRAARREERFLGLAVPGFFRKPYGPGWSLVGDAGYSKDFITAQGISDAFRDAELCAGALDGVFSGARSFDEAMGVYQAARDEQVLPMYEFTAQLATLEPPPPELQQVLAAAHGNQEAMDGFARVNAGVTSPAEYFSTANVKRILDAAR
ncbi:MAG TPA: NAD(P)/FAD-dependent oxidoreductase [Candidatus Krumholzibacteria bacterium]|nr:NAD(P)/FAD-dependent oxidoreductase [Candidatus Krumholzibacteria bacterium]HPD70443.1 NAD(P)/FAD-dependent oxidoreductase [Candidatus Krumholzibacteria bacterium]HRY39857.1 NAD(P)/FAD-dependent oxidoreductase [Candidatus Krumholzibacteria bacterium]